MHGRIGDWEKTEIKPEAFTLADFIGWLETKDPQATYDFHHRHGECLMGQYMAERGRSWRPAKREKHTRYIDSCEQVFGNPFNVPVLSEEPHTFGSALKRARKAVTRRNDTR